MKKDLSLDALWKQLDKSAETEDKAKLDEIGNKLQLAACYLQLKSNPEQTVRAILIGGNRYANN